jgi:hypothetical protein
MAYIRFWVRFSTSPTDRPRRPIHTGTDEFDHLLMARPEVGKVINIRVMLPHAERCRQGLLLMDVKRLKLVLGIVAVVILAGSAAAYYYSQQPKGDVSKVVVNGQDYPWDTLYQKFDAEDFATDEESLEGIRLSDIVNDTGLEDPGEHQYRVTGSDGYEKDVSWDDMTNGFLVKEGKRTVFPGLTRSFWVMDVISIEVV